METIPGINPNFQLKENKFQPITWEVIKTFAKSWYITNGIEAFQIANSAYGAIFLKPTDDLKHKFNLEREIILIFSNYPTFQPRCFDAIDFVRKNYQTVRFEEICSIMISNDDNVENIVHGILKSNQESQIIIPFSYKELRKYNTSNYIESKIRKHFYTRDLFAYQSALQKDLYFFGRKNIIHELVNRHLTFENSGVFGLRKTGKTSILYSVQRILEVKGGVSVLIDCQDTAVYEKRWNEVLYFIMKELYDKYSVEVKFSKDEYVPSMASENFSRDISLFNSKLGQPILFIFDEVERITFDVSDSEFWRNGQDFIAFWRTMRANFQKKPGVFTYLIASTNPKSVEVPSINGIDNPIFSQLREFYIQHFEIEETKEMVNRLGGYMGIQFDEDIPTYLTRDYGGHPFLMRHVCSTINELIKTNERPFKVDRIIYENAKKIFEIEKTKGITYSEMILDVLEKFYPDEYLMLEALALEDYDFFYEFARESPMYTSHLIGYGIISKNKDHYDFKIDTLKRFLISKSRYKKINQTNKEKQQEISERRNRLEENLRIIARKQLKYKFGEQEAKKQILSFYSPDKQNKLVKLIYEDLFNPKKGEIFFEQLRQIYQKFWEECFRHIFEVDISKFNTRMLIINELRVGDSHAGEITDAEMQSFRGAISWLEEKVTGYFK